MQPAECTERIKIPVCGCARTIRKASLSLEHVKGDKHGVQVVEAKQQSATAMEPSSVQRKHPTAPPAAAPQQQQQLQQPQQQQLRQPQQQPTQSAPPQADLLLPGFDTEDPQPRSAMKSLHAGAERMSALVNRHWLSGPDLGIATLYANLCSCPSFVVAAGLATIEYDLLMQVCQWRAIKCHNHTGY